MKTLIAYASLTGNTEAMAQAIYEGASAASAEVKLCRADDISAAEALSYDTLILGSPAMGAEVLEESVMEPFFTELESGLSGKRVALFGSYDWGDGQWMRAWEERCRNAGALLVNNEGLIANLSPDEEAIAACKALGEKAVQA